MGREREGKGEGEGEWLLGTGQEASGAAIGVSGSWQKWNSGFFFFSFFMLSLAPS